MNRRRDGWVTAVLVAAVLWFGIGVLFGVWP